MSKERLAAAIEEVYGRLAAGTLRPADTVTPAELKQTTPRRWIDGFMLHRTVHDEDARILRVFRREHGAILDIGAYWGYMAASFRNAGATAPIVSFEPMPAHHACLDELRRIDGNYDFCKLALSEHPGTVTLYGPVVNGKALMGLNSVDGAIFDIYHKQHLVSLHGGEIADAPDYRIQFLLTPFETRRLDDVLAGRRLRFLPPFRVDTRRIAALKLDVEGHEPHVLRGATDLIARDRPFVMIESGNRNPAVAELLRAAGYRYAERDGLKLVETDGYSDAPNGYWFHGERIEEYRDLGLL